MIEKTKGQFKGVKAKTLSKVKEEVKNPGVKKIWGFLREIHRLDYCIINNLPPYKLSKAKRKKHTNKFVLRNLLFEASHLSPFQCHLLRRLLHVTKMTTIKRGLVLATYIGWNLQQMDVKSAFYITFRVCLIKKVSDGLTANIKSWYIREK
ncbi:hypothetical protein O6H91_03G130400 [Diphasiastrum complanatum]|uniref:Uncharacterized protein n=1 Tax=Diphasiastrum complanatum TaxID=34168 RepID=A0ACC2EC20_DIPCM|nr:hypothetical protein O6H91_03G130400 [Diphasiastrum complanatum]